MSITRHSDFARPDPSLIDGFRAIGSSTVGNVLDDLGVGGIMLNIRPVVPGLRFVGPAYTVRESFGIKDTFTAEEFGLGAVIDTAANGDVIVIDNGGHQVSTWGGIASFAAQKRGVAGLVVDGGVRDADEIREFGFPVYSRHVVPLSGKTRVKVTEIGGRVTIDSVRVDAGDILVGDTTGIVCVPAARAEEVLERASRLEADDRRAIGEIAKGLGFTAALARFPKL